MPQFRIADAARLLGVSDDTVRRWVEDFREALELLEALSQEGWLRLSAAKAQARTAAGRDQSPLKKKRKKTLIPKAPS